MYMYVAYNDFKVYAGSRSLHSFLCLFQGVLNTFLHHSPVYQKFNKRGDLLGLTFR